MCCICCWKVCACIRVYQLGTWAVIKQFVHKHKDATKDLGSLPDQAGRVAIVTGGNQGIGAEVVQILCSFNIHVIMAARGQSEAEATIARIKEHQQSAKVEFLQLDLASKDSINRFVQDFNEKGLQLHLLINNAGVMFPPYRKTDEGLEIQLAVNYMGPFLLTRLLLPKLVSSGTADCYSRIVNVSSILHSLEYFDRENLLQSNPSTYSPHAAYAESKLAMAMSTYHLNDALRLNGDFVTANTLHPGVVETGLHQNIHWSAAWALNLLAKAFYLTPRQGADTIIYAAVSPTLEGDGGLYLDNCEAKYSSRMSYDLDLQADTWQKSSVAWGLDIKL